LARWAVVAVLVPPMAMFARQGNTVAPVPGHGLLKGLEGNMGFHFQGGLPLFKIDIDMLYPRYLGQGILYMGPATVTAHPVYLIGMFHRF